MWDLALKERRDTVDEVRTLAGVRGALGERNREATYEVIEKALERLG